MSAIYIDGNWVDLKEPREFQSVNPATEEPLGLVWLGNAVDVDKAAKAAESVFPSYSETPTFERVALLKTILECYQSRMEELAETISIEMGAPRSLAVPIDRLTQSFRRCPERSFA